MRAATIIDGEWPVTDSCIPGFHKLSIPERVRAVRERGLLSPEDSRALLNG